MNVICALQALKLNYISHMKESCLGCHLAKLVCKRLVCWAAYRSLNRTGVIYYLALVMLMSANWIAEKSVCLLEIGWEVPNLSQKQPVMSLKMIGKGFYRRWVKSSFEQFITMQTRVGSTSGWIISQNTENLKFYFSTISGNLQNLWRHHMAKFRWRWP